MNEANKTKAIKRYIKENCTILTSPRCSCCNASGSTEIYQDDLSGDDFCYSCLVKDLSKDEESLKEYLEVHGE
jgi:hypothetical protein